MKKWELQEPQVSELDDESTIRFPPRRQAIHQRQRFSYPSQPPPPPPEQPHNENNHQVPWPQTMDVRIVQGLQLLVQEGIGTILIDLGRALLSVVEHLGKNQDKTMNLERNPEVQVINNCPQPNVINQIYPTASVQNNISIPQTNINNNIDLYPQIQTPQVNNQIVLPELNPTIQNNIYPQIEVPQVNNLINLPELKTEVFLPELKPNIVLPEMNNQYHNNISLPPLQPNIILPEPKTQIQNIFSPQLTIPVNHQAIVLSQDPAIKDILAQLVKRSNQKTLKMESKITEIIVGKSDQDKIKKTTECGTGDRQIAMKTSFCQATKKMVSSSTQTSSRKQRWRQKKPKFCPNIIINLQKEEHQGSLHSSQKTVTQKKHSHFIAKQAIKDVVKQQLSRKRYISKQFISQLIEQKCQHLLPQRQTELQDTRQKDSIDQQSKTPDYDEKSMRSQSEIECHSNQEQISMSKQSEESHSQEEIQIKEQLKRMIQEGEIDLQEVQMIREAMLSSNIMDQQGNLDLGFSYDSDWDDEYDQPSGD